MPFQLQDTVNFAQLYLRRVPLLGAGGVTNEPALTIGNTVRQFIMGPPFNWRWSRAQTSFISSIGVQDYTLTSWTANATYALGVITIDPNGNQQQVTIAGVAGGSTPPWSATQDANTVDGTVTWKNIGGVPIKKPLASFGWLESAVVADKSASTFELEIRLNSNPEGDQNRPTTVAAWLDDGAGQITFRLFPPPDQVYVVTLAYQIAAPVFTSPAQLWSPVPDYFQYLYTAGFLAKAYEYMNDERYLPTEQIFVRQLMAAADGLDESQINIFLPERLISGRQSQNVADNAQKGRQGRGLFNG